MTGDNGKLTKYNVSLNAHILQFIHNMDTNIPDNKTQNSSLTWNKHNQICLMTGDNGKLTKYNVSLNAHILQFIHNMDTILH